MRSLVSSLSFLGLLFMIFGGYAIQFFQRYPLAGYGLGILIGFWILLEGLNGYLSEKLIPWNGLTLIQVVQMYGWSAFFRGRE